ncbi:MAG: cache domain-containing protein [Microbacterium sp.]
MTTTVTRSIADVAAHVATTIDDIFATIDGWRALLEDRLGMDAAPTAAAVDPLIETFAVPAVGGGTLLTGAGFVAAPGVLADAEWHLAWWLADPRTRARRLATIDDPAHDQFRDYTTLEWWRVPASTGARHLTGPYVDYVCTDDYTVTITTPVMVGGRMLGVVGADALVDRLERALLPVLRSGGAPATVVNASGRVVTSTDARREPGSILRLAGLAGAIASPGTLAPLDGGGGVVACGDTSLALVVGV